MAHNVLLNIDKIKDTIDTLHKFLVLPVYAVIATRCIITNTPLILHADHNECLDDNKLVDDRS